MMRLIFPSSRVFDVIAMFCGMRSPHSNTALPSSRVSMETPFGRVMSAWNPYTSMKLSMATLILRYVLSGFMASVSSVA